ncbi:hypothetical protein RJ639_005566 [Escallonia herrerae]|uniref:Inhibitor I9 domain-containing protein n=1 Tax=Escallonia herrerae TaxID=1293975 RepID=A0AA88VTB0_9ASTE|nr:hypothetical protein RJ639_005566 [Escallonia herrerae]
MEGFFQSHLLVVFILFILVAIPFSTSDERRTYIIHMDKSAMPAPFLVHHSWYMSTLSSLPSSDGVSPLHLYTYNHVLDGFSAVLSRSHLEQLERIPGHVATYEETFGQIHTTHTPNKEACDSFSLDPKDVEGKYVFCVQSDYPDPSEIYRAGALGAIISSDGGQFLRPYDFPIPFVRVLTNVVDSSCAYRAMVKAPSTMKVVVEPETIYFTKKCSTAEFNLTVEIDLSHNPWNDYFGNSGYLSWYELNGTHIVRSPIVSAYAP